MNKIQKEMPKGTKFWKRDIFVKRTEKKIYTEDKAKGENSVCRKYLLGSRIKEKKLNFCVVFTISNISYFWDICNGNTVLKQGP